MSRASQQERGISRQRLMQMLSRRRPDAETPVAGGADAPLYDWRRPHHYEPTSWLIMKNLGKKIAAYIEKSLSLVCLEEPKVTFESVVQEFANVPADKALRQEKPQYFMPLQAAAKSPDGYVNFQMEAAAALVAQTLRDPDSTVAAGGVLSTLEESILQDAAIVVADAITIAMQEHGGIAVRRADRIIKGDWPLSARQFEDLCGFKFLLAYPKQTVEITALFVAEAIDSAAGIHRTHRTLNPVELSRQIVRQIQDVPVDIVSQLCISSIRMEDLMRLESGDILNLNKKIDEPINVLLNDRVCFQAWPVQCEGKQALRIATFKK